MHCFRSPKGSQQIQTCSTGWSCFGFNIASPLQFCVQTWHIHGEADMKELRDAVAQQAQKVQVPQLVEELLTYPLRSKPWIWQVYFVRSLGLFWHSSNIVWRLFPQLFSEARLVCLLLFFDILHHWKTSTCYGYKATKWPTPIHVEALNQLLTSSDEDDKKKKKKKGEVGRQKVLNYPPWN